MTAAGGKKMIVSCKLCMKEFTVFKSKYETAQRKFNGNLYCSRSCSRKAQPAFYQTFYWCHKCKWVRQKLAILKEKGSQILITDKCNSRLKKYHLKKDRLYCPHCWGLLTVKQPRKNQQSK